MKVQNPKLGELEDFVRYVGEAVEGQVEPGQRLGLLDDVPRQGRQPADVGQEVVVEPQRRRDKPLVLELRGCAARPGSTWRFVLCDFCGTGKS